MNEIVITKDKAVFWMDARGRWCNAHGPFEHAKIIQYFNSAIRKDEGGYFVEQIGDGVREKVYFKYADTALFAVDVVGAGQPRLVLNTGETVGLKPALLFIHKDHLYQRHGAGECIKFGERLLVKIAEWLDCRQGVYILRLAGKEYPIPEE